MPFIVLLLLCCTNEKEIKLYHPDGSLKAKYTQIDGKIEGSYTQYYTSGKVQFNCFFKDDFENGPFTTYYENGNIKLEGQFIWGFPYSHWYYYNENINNKLDSIVEYILRKEDENVFESLERDTITKDIIQDGILYTNSKVIFKDNGEIDMDKSFYYEVYFDSIVRENTMTFYLSFSNPYKHYEYKSDSIEVITYINSVENKEISYKMLSKEAPIHITGTLPIKKGKQNFYTIITLHHNNGNINELLMRISS